MRSGKMRDIDEMKEKALKAIDKQAMFGEILILTNTTGHTFLINIWRRGDMLAPDDVQQRLVMSGLDLSEKEREAHISRRIPRLSTATAWSRA